jgi:hypothetical protein
VDKALPFAKHAKLRTSALNIVFEHLAQQPGAVVLPVDLCQREIAQFGLEQRQTLTGLSLTCYAMYLKETSNSSMKDVIDFLTAKTEQGA